MDGHRTVALLLLVFVGATNAQDAIKTEFYDCEFAKYEKLYYEVDSIFSDQRGFSNKSLDECMDWCLLRPECKSINHMVSNNFCSFSMSGIQDANKELAAKRATAQKSWNHYRLVGCPEPSSTTSVGCGIQPNLIPAMRPTVYVPSLTRPDWLPNPGYTYPGLYVPSLTRIIGGKEATQHTWPWQSVLRTTTNGATLYSGTFQCGSSLIRVKDNVEASDILLTAAHCISDMIPNTSNHVINKPSEISAVLGTHYRDQFQAGAQVRSVDKIVAHPNYNSGPNANDVALIKLSKPVKFSDRIRPICLPKQGEALPVGKFCVAAGWGRVNSSDSYLLSPVMKELNVPVHEASICKRGYGDKYVEGQMVCAGNLNGDSGICKGDSGGMLACKDGTKWSLYGVSSFVGATNCLKENRPGVFVRASSYVDWVQQTLATMTSL